MSSSTRFDALIVSATALALSLACAGAIAQDAGQPAMHRSMADMDTDKDGRLSRSEFAAAHGGKLDAFAAHDGNGDGFISQAEMDAHHAGMKASHEAAHTTQQAEGPPHH